MRVRFGRSLARKTLVSWRDDPSQHDIEALRANIDRVGLVIRIRWVIVATLMVFSLVGGLVFTTTLTTDTFVDNMRVPAVALVFVIAYNTYYQLTYRRFGNIAYLNQAQLLLDMVVATVLVYYSGGALSWFSSIYLLFILEGAFILPRPRHVWFLAGAAAFMLGCVYFGCYMGWLPPLDLPIVDSALGRNITYVIARYLWEITMFAGATFAGTLLIRGVLERGPHAGANGFVDGLTGLFNAVYFQRVLARECARAGAGGSELALLLVDVDRLGDVNQVFGLTTGDRLLVKVAERISIAADGDDVSYALVPGIACRVGGEEFALILPGAGAGTGGREPLRERATRIAEELRSSIGALRVDDVGVTVSIGIAIFPGHGATPEDLLDSADQALAAATLAGGNRAVLPARESGFDVAIGGENSPGGVVAADGEEAEAEDAVERDEEGRITPDAGDPTGRE